MRELSLKIAMNHLSIYFKDDPVSLQLIFNISMPQLKWCNYVNPNLPCINLPRFLCGFSARFIIIYFIVFVFRINSGNGGGIA